MRQVSTLAVLYGTSLHSLKTWANYSDLFRRTLGAWPWSMLQGDDVTEMSYNWPPICTLAFIPSPELCASFRYSVKRWQVSRLQQVDWHLIAGRT